MMRKRTLVTIIGAIVTAVALWGQTGDLPRSTPTAQGLNTTAVTRFIDSLLALPQTQVHHVMVVRHGHVVAEAHPAPFRAEDAHTLYSASKTFVALAVGLAIDDNRLRLNDRVAALMHDYLPDTVSDALAQITVRHLLTMSSGITPDWVMRNLTTEWERTWLAKPVTTPGERLLYDSMATYMLSAIVQRVMGKTVLELLQERLFAPMHITRVDWELSPNGVCTGGWGLRLQAESLAKVGVLMLQRGRWEDRQLVPEWWIDEMTTAHINYDNATTQAPTDGNRGYGYQVWRCKWPTAFRADGALGQYLVMDSASDMAVVILGVSRRGHDELGCIWNQLMPGVDRPDGKAKKAFARLNSTCEQASLPLVEGEEFSPFGDFFTFVPAANKHQLTKVRLFRECGRLLLILSRDGKPDEVIPLGYRGWEYYDAPAPLKVEPPYSITALGRFTGLRPDFVTAASYAWTSPATIEVRVHYVNFISGTNYVLDVRQKTVTITDNFAPHPPEVITCEVLYE